MAKPKKKKPQWKIPIAASVGVAAGFFVAPPGWASPVEAALAGDAKRVGDALVANYLFYDNTVNKFDFLGKGIGIKLAFVGGLISLIASKIGLNRRLRQVPFVRI